MGYRKGVAGLAVLALASGCGQEKAGSSTNAATSAENLAMNDAAPARPPTAENISVPAAAPTAAPPPSAADIALAQTDVGKRVIKIVVEHLGVESRFVTMNASFIDNLKADSLDLVELVMAFEEEFGVEIPDDAAERLVTVGDSVRYIEAHKA